MGFFLATLDVSEGLIKNIVKNRDETTSFPKKSERGGKKNNSRPESSRDYIRQHIKSFILPREESSSSPKKKRKRDDEEEEQLVVAGLNTTRMYNAYVRQCEWNGIKPEKLWLYRDIVRTDFNIKFLDPNPRRVMPKLEGDSLDVSYIGESDLLEEIVEEEEQEGEEPADVSHEVEVLPAEYYCEDVEED